MKLSSLHFQEFCQFVSGNSEKTIFKYFLYSLKICEKAMSII